MKAMSATGAWKTRDAGWMFQRTSPGMHWWWNLWKGRRKLRNRNQRKAVRRDLPKQPHPETEELLAVIRAADDREAEVECDRHGAEHGDDDAGADAGADA